MNKRIKNKWLKALRLPVDEGGYHQGEHRLVTECEGTGEFRFCGLGVLQNIYHDEKNTTFKPKSFEYHNHTKYAQKWSGLGSLDDDARTRKLVHMNDHGDSFLAIADYIEENL